MDVSNVTSFCGVLTGEAFVSGFDSNTVEKVHRWGYCFWHFDPMREVTKDAQLSSSSVCYRLS
jgi:hypothetical protein